MMWISIFLFVTWRGPVGGCQYFGEKYILRLHYDDLNGILNGCSPSSYGATSTH